MIIACRNCKYYRVQHFNIGDVWVCCLGEMYSNMIESECQHFKHKDINISFTYDEIRVIKEMITSKCYSFDREIQDNIKRKL